jgi:3-oxoacyl-[acyl-carrier-protein] synthase I
MSLWPKFSPADSEPASATAWQPLQVVSRGMCCAVGNSAPAATAAINARMNHFRETGFVARGGSPIVGGALHEVDMWGAERLRYMLHSVIHEALAGAGSIDTAQIAIFALGAEPTRPGMSSSNCLAEALRDFVNEAGERGSAFHATTRFCNYGKAGIGRVLEEVSQLLAGEQGPQYALLAAADSLLDAGAVERYLDEERIATRTNSDGFIPAEGAAAVLLTGAAAPTPTMWIESAATAREDWRIHSDSPLRAQGLTNAIRNAALAAKCQVSSLDFHASGMTGESWYSKEVGLALARCMEHKKPEFPHLMVARSLGETGAASPLLTLAWLAGLMGQGHYHPGHSGLLHFAGDDGQRTAVIVRFGEPSHVMK